jgi:hypothetical protein
LLPYRNHIGVNLLIDGNRTFGLAERRPISADVRPGDADTRGKPWREGAQPNAFALWWWRGAIGGEGAAVEYKSARATIGIPVLIHHSLDDACECLGYSEERLSYEPSQTPKYSQKNSKRDSNRVQCNRNSFFSVQIAPSDPVDFFNCFENACQ